MRLQGAAMDLTDLFSPNTGAPTPNFTLGLWLGALASPIEPIVSASGLFALESRRRFELNLAQCLALVGSFAQVLVARAAPSSSTLTKTGCLRLDHTLIRVSFGFPTYAHSMSVFVNICLFFQTSSNGSCRR